MRGRLRNRAQRHTASGRCESTASSTPSSSSDPRGSSREIAKKPRTTSEPTEPQLGPVWEHTDSGWWVVEQNGMLRTGPFQSKERGREWFYRELDIKLGI